jgi:hypothetical protein
MKTSGWFFVFLCLSLSPLFSQEKKAPPKPEDFAGTLTLSGYSGSLMALELPEYLYQRLERSDLGDLRVFDASGSLVPATLRKPPKQSITPPPEPAPFFIWKTPSRTPRSLPNNRDIEIDAAGGVVKITGAQENSPEPPAYLVDLSGLSRQPEKLNVTVEHGGRFFNGVAILHSSSDLNQWRVYDLKQTLAYYGNSGADREELTIPPDAKYLLLSFEGNVPPIKGVEAHFAPFDAPAVLRETRIAGKKNPPGTAIQYNTQGHYPISSIDFRLQEPDSLPVYIKNRFRSDEPWRILAQERIYRIYSGTSGELQTNTPFGLNSPAPYWELEINGERRFESPPDCYIHWEPYELIFLARGPGPWVAAYGNAGYPPLSEDGLALPHGKIFPSAEVVREGAYKPRDPESGSPVQWSRWVLLGSLILGALGLSGLAVYIAKRMNLGN